MKEITIKTQKEFNKLPSKFDEFTKIILNADLLRVAKTPDNSFFVVRGGTIQYVEGGTIQSVEGGTIQYVWGGTIQDVWGSATIHLFGKSNIGIAKYPSVIICRNGYKQKIKGNSTVINQSAENYTKKDFVELFGGREGTITLYKSVNPDTLCDFKTGKIRYEVGKEVICPDWNPDKTVQCGNGLHLSPTPAMALSYNHGKVLKCEVDIKDFVVYSKDITKVRCKKVKVIEEIK